MSKESRKIHGAPRIGNVTFREGQEGEFAKAASAAQIASLTERGVIEGFKSTTPVSESEGAESPDTLEGAKTGAKATAKSRRDTKEK